MSFGAWKKFRRWLSGEGQYRYRAWRSFVFHTAIYGRSFENDWVQLEPDGLFTVKYGYAWNGCSPTWLLFRWIYIGTPDRPYNPATGLPITGLASMLHDALEQFNVELGITHAESAAEFCRELRTTGWWAANIYCQAVRKFGPQDPDDDRNSIDYPSDYRQ